MASSACVWIISDLTDLLHQALKLPRCQAKLPRLCPTPVVIDLSGVEMIDAAGLRAIISVALTAQASQCSVKLAAPGNLIRQLLELTKLTSVFEVHPTLEAATVASRGQAA